MPWIFVDQNATQPKPPAGRKIGRHGSAARGEWWLLRQATARRSRASMNAWTRSRVRRLRLP